MIITVTLNAAIDKSLSVPSFRLGRRHRTVEQWTLAGGKGGLFGNTLRIKPPMCLTKGDADFLVDCLDEVLETVGSTR